MEKIKGGRSNHPNALSHLGIPRVKQRSKMSSSILVAAVVLAFASFAYGECAQLIG